MDRKTNYSGPPLWTATFDPSLQIPRGGLMMAFNDRNNIPMNNVSHEGNSDDDDYLDENCFDDIILQQAEEVDEERGEEQGEDDESDVDYPSRVHSIHRNKLYGPQSNITEAVDARIGNVRRSKVDRNLSAGDMTQFFENHANLIVAKMEQDPILMEDSPTSEELRKETLRDMPQCLTLKRRVRVKLSKSVSQKSKKKPLSWYKMFKYRTSITYSKFKLDMKSLLYSFELWYGSIKQIEGNFGSGVASFFKFLRWIFILDVFVALLTFSFIVIPQLIFDTKNIMAFKDFHWTNVFSGEGYLENTFLYYGFYTNETISVHVLSYNMTQAYFFTMVCLYLFCFAILSISVARSYRRSFIETEGGLKNIYAHKVFCGWDYNIATEDAAKLKSHAIYNELRELLNENMRNSQKDTFIVIFWTTMMQLTMNVFILISFISTGYVMWFFMGKAAEEGWQSIYTAIVVNVVMTFFPIVLSCIVRYEGYKSPKTALNLTLIRTFVLGFVVIGISVTFWLQHPDHDCWETSLGQEIYRLVLFDFIFSVLILPIFDIIWYGFSRCLYKSDLIFDIARNTMQVIYNQTLLWVGLFFSPFLPVIVLFKLFLMWYARKWVVLKFCKPSSRSWRAAQTTTWFLMMAFLSLLFVMGLLGYMLTYIPTTSCGPFSHYEYIYELVTLGVLHLQKGNRAWQVFLFVTRPGFIALVMIALCVRVYYLRAKAKAQRGIVALYREMLVWESKDKEFLLQKISIVTKGQWQYKLQDGRKLDPITSLASVQKFVGSGGDVLAEDPPSQFIFMTPSSSSIDPTSSGTDLDAQLYARYKKFS